MPINFLNFSCLGFPFPFTNCQEVQGLFFYPISSPIKGFQNGTQILSLTVTWSLLGDGLVLLIGTPFASWGHRFSPPGFFFLYCFALPPIRAFPVLLFTPPPQFDSPSPQKLELSTTLVDQVFRRPQIYITMGPRKGGALPLQTPRLFLFSFAACFFFQFDPPSLSPPPKEGPEHTPFSNTLPSFPQPTTFPCFFPCPCVRRSCKLPSPGASGPLIRLFPFFFVGTPDFPPPPCPMGAPPEFLGLRGKVPFFFWRSAFRFFLGRPRPFPLFGYLQEGFLLFTPLSVCAGSGFRPSLDLGLSKIVHHPKRCPTHNTPPFLAPFFLFPLFLSLRFLFSRHRCILLGMISFLGLESCPPLSPSFFKLTFWRDPLNITFLSLLFPFLPTSVVAYLGFHNLLLVVFVLATPPPPLCLSVTFAVLPSVFLLLL